MGTTWFRSDLHSRQDKAIGNPIYPVNPTARSATPLSRCLAPFVTEDFSPATTGRHKTGPYASPV